MLRRKSLIGFWGLSLREMPHRFRVNGRQLYTWCAWDTLFLPQLIGRSAEVESTCPTTGDRISLTVGADGVETVSTADVRVSFLTPSAPFDADMIMSFCHYVLFFGSERAGKEWTERHEGTFLLTVDEADAVGRLNNRARFGDALADGTVIRAR